MLKLVVTGLLSSIAFTSNALPTDVGSLSEADKFVECAAAKDYQFKKSNPALKGVHDISAALLVKSAQSTGADAKSKSTELKKAFDAKVESYKSGGAVADANVEKCTEITKTLLTQDSTLISQAKEFKKVAGF